MADPTEAFIRRWESSGASERANYQLFLSELCDILEVPSPDPATPDDSENAYVFERAVVFRHGDGSSSTGRIDLYKRGCFVLEAKQGVEKRVEEEALSEMDGPAKPIQIAKAFKGAKTDRVAELLETLATLGQARKIDGGRFGV